MPSKYAYWDSRCLGQSVRYLLDYVGEDYEDIRYFIGPAPEYDKTKWLNEKFTLGLDIPNLPYYIDGDFKLTESNAILRYLARKYDLYGKDNKEMAYADMLIDTFTDVRDQFYEMCYGDYTEATQQKFKDKFKVRVPVFEKLLGDKQFFLGDKVTVADFLIYEMLEQHRLYHDGLFDDTPNLRAYLNRFEEIPAIKKHISTEKFKNLLINNPYAGFH